MIATHVSAVNAASINVCYFNRRPFIFNYFPFCVGDMKILHIKAVEILLSLSAKFISEKTFLEYFGFMKLQIWS
jgi:hypothetical protein